MTDEANRRLSTDASVEEAVRAALDGVSGSRRRRGSRFVLAALGGLPWVGGILGAAAAFDSDAQQGQVNDLQRQWLDEHRRKLAEVAETLGRIGQRVEELGDEAKARLESEGYLALVRKAFGAWDRSETQDKRDVLRRLLENAAGTTICSDDVVRLFIDWIERYHEAHFMIVREVYGSPRCSRAEIWLAIHGESVREDSAEADLFSLLVRDLSTGGVVRQYRETTTDGRFVQKKAPRTTRRTGAPKMMKSRFDGKEQCVLTELGKQFVHYVFTDSVRRIGPDQASDA